MEAERVTENLLTMDVEDWSASSFFLLPEKERAAARASLPATDAQTERGVRRLMDLLAEAGFRGTFFILGETAKRHKGLIREIHARGHEAASHSMTHALLGGLPASRLAHELTDSRKLLEDLLGARVLGFRAPNLSIGADAGLFFRELEAAGYIYDSSLTTATAERALRPAGRENRGTAFPQGIREIPVTMYHKGYPAAPLGGWYLRWPGIRGVLRAIRRENVLENKPAVIYVHPYELDDFPVSWPHPSPSWRGVISLWLRNVGKSGYRELLAELLRRRRFTTIREYVSGVSGSC